MNDFVTRIKNANDFHGVHQFKFDGPSYDATYEILLEWEDHLKNNTPKRSFWNRLGFGDYGSKLAAYNEEWELFYTYNKAFSQCKVNRFVSKDIATLFV